MLTIVEDTRCPFNGLQPPNSIFNLPIHKTIVIRYVVIESTVTYMWNLVTVKNSHELLVEFPMYFLQPMTGAMVNSTTLFLQVPGSNPCHEKLFLQHFMTYAYMWDPGTIYDDLEHSIFEKNAYMWDSTKIFDDLEHSILK
jgi:hypothetical protein